jgi:hypothetical protein
MGGGGGGPDLYLDDLRALVTLTYRYTIGVPNFRRDV